MKHLLVTIAMLCAIALVTGCGNGSGVHTQSGDPASSPMPTVTTTTPDPSWTPPMYGAAGPAVEALTNMLAAYAGAVMSTTATSVAFDKYLAGQAKQAFDDSFASARKSGVIYRGTPPTPRIVVETDNTTASVPEVVAVNCPLESNDPLIAYDAESGRPVPTSSAGVPKPWAQTAKLFFLNGEWIITSFTTDSTKTCTR